MRRISNISDGAECAGVIAVMLAIKTPYYGWGMRCRSSSAAKVGLLSLTKACRPRLAVRVSQTNRWREVSKVSESVHRMSVGHNYRLFRLGSKSVNFLASVNIIDTPIKGKCNAEKKREVDSMHISIKLGHL